MSRKSKKIRDLENTTLSRDFRSHKACQSNLAVVRKVSLSLTERYYMVHFTKKTLFLQSPHLFVSSISFPIFFFLLQQ